MAKQVKLAAQIRPETGRTAVKKIKSLGFVPAVIYSHDETPVSLKVSERDITTVLSHAVGEHLLVDLEIAGGANRLALIQEVQHHPVTQKVLHVDFHGVSANEAIEASVPLEATGDAIGVKNGGILEQPLRALTISCLPQDLPEIVTVDVSALAIGKSLHVKDIALPSGVTAVDDADVIAFLVAEPAAIPEPVAPAAEEAAAGPEVIKEKKPAAEEKEKK
ncbi:MAG: 50S ribosomal protein L25 [Chthoniobacteraceae bacterium]|nr:50S ribosomal protein L25 [Chthoniobacteraceae bacterium]